MIFKLAWTWYDDYHDYILEHSSKTKKEFQKDCIRAYRECAEEYFKSGGWVGAREWLDFTYQKLLSYGYTKPKMGSFLTYGEYIINGEGNQEDSKEFKKIVGEKLYKQALEINKKIEDKLNKRHL